MGADCKVSLVPQAEADPGPLDIQTEGVHVCRTQGPLGLDEATADPRRQPVRPGAKTCNRSRPLPHLR